MPHTLPQVQEIVHWLRRFTTTPATLLVVPGRAWPEPALRTLRALQISGHPLAGHGWTHRARERRSAWHRLHAATISRGVAEHLSLNSASIRALICRCYRWFERSGLDTPELYVPPAWAMGAIARPALRELPFSQYESLAGVYDVATDRLRRLPLVGYEADRPACVSPLRAWNAVNTAWAVRAGVPLRIAIHPGDLQLPLAGDLERVLSAHEGDDNTQ